MHLQVRNKKLSLYNNLRVTLKYDSVGDTFSFTFYFDPANKEHREIFLPLSYPEVKVWHNDELLITGMLLSHSFGKSAVKRLISVGGYSNSGVLEDSSIGEVGELSGLTLVQVASRLIQPYALALVVDDVVKDDANKVISVNTDMKPENKIKDILTDLARYRNIVLSHNEKGDLVLTRADTKRKPVYHFEDDMKGIDIWLDVNGQMMHDQITCVNDYAGNNAAEAKIKNPYLSSTRDRGTEPGGYLALNRPIIIKDSDSNEIEIPRTARFYLGLELKAIRLKIRMYGWELGGKLVRPNMMITVTSPENFLYQPTRFFVEEVQLELERESFAEVCTLSCVVAEVYNNDVPVNIFTGSNLTVPVKAGDQFSIINVGVIEGKL
jgi:prophage tail gpP-like protein